MEKILSKDKRIAIIEIYEVDQDFLGILRTPTDPLMRVLHLPPGLDPYEEADELGRLVCVTGGRPVHRGLALHVDQPDVGPQLGEHLGLVVVAVGRGPVEGSPQVDVSYVH